MTALPRSTESPPDAVQRRTAWQPILDGPQADRAGEAVDDIVRDLDHFRPPVLPPHGGVTEQMKMSFELSLGSGEVGRALLQTYARRCGVIAEAAAERTFASIAEKLPAAELEPWLFFGLAGILWAMQHSGFANALHAADSASEGAPLLPMFATFLKRRPPRGEFDLMRGVCGAIVFALEHLPDPYARECVESALDRLEEMGEGDNAEEIVWRTENFRLPAGQIIQSEENAYVVGLAHGLSGVIAALARVHDAGIARDHCESLLRRAMTWLQRRSDAAPARFPSALLLDGTVIRWPFSWCHGEIGVAIGVLKAGRALQDAQWTDMALSVLERLARDSFEFVDYPDASNCHGTGGYAHMLNRVYQATGRAPFRDAARHWLDITLDLRRPGDGIGGFRYGQPPGEAATAEGMKDPGFLMGSAGTGLVLLAAFTDVPPLWDRLFLLDM